MAMVEKRWAGPVASPYLVSDDGRFRVKGADTKPPKGERDDEANERALAERSEELSKLQSRLIAAKRHSLLVIFQAMDAAGKDGTLRAVMRGVNPAGVVVHSFRAPSEEEVAHDFLWRASRHLPERGEIGIFNRSHYEEVLVVRVHPEYLERQGLRALSRKQLSALWSERYQSIRDFEQHLARNGTTIVKLWLNVSKGEQKKRLLARVDDPEANWKFDANDIRERAEWSKYMDAYEHALNETTRPWAPWYAIPADDKKFMRATVADILVRTLQKIDPELPEPTPEQRALMRKVARELGRD